jgi:hypothetical protein|tara:strand:- start:1604 stop:2035 length:432 start_codon:yes stop_codon:yes gene_type:complete
MTMHLVGPYMTTTKYNRKKKQKNLSVSQQENLVRQWKAHNKDCRRRHIHSAQFEKFEDFCAYVNGTYKAPKVKTTAKAYEPPKVREGKVYPSLGNNIGGPALRKEVMVYSGERKLLGIATMHKSNLVPVFSEDEAVELAQMRR